MKKLYPTVIVIMAVAAIALFIQRTLRQSGPVDQTVYTASPTPAVPSSTETEVSRAVYKDMIEVFSPLPDSRVSSPLTIIGRARGMWFFEASFPVFLTDWDGRIIAQGIATATEDWMTEDYVPFKAVLEFETPLSLAGVVNQGALILKKDNPSGLPEHEDAFEFRVFFGE